jgi:holo-[acyl-carrier protein] synthase
MIIGIGVDTIEVPRMARAVSNPRTGQRFKERVFTPGEIAYCERRPRTAAQSYAARFAAKEATMKALGRGFGGGIGWREIEVVRDRGAPRLVLSGHALALALERGIRRWHVSLTHTEAAAMAFVIGEDIEDRGIAD